MSPSKDDEVGADLDETSTPEPHSVLEEGVDLASASQLTEVYETDNEVEASVVIAEVLGAAGIEALRHDRRSHAISAPAAMSGTIGIAVPEGQAERARQLIREAQADGVLGGGAGSDRPETPETGPGTMIA